MPQGRPSIYSQELADHICDQLSGGVSLREICRQDDMPSMSTIMRWLFDTDYKPFWEQYAKAREKQAEVMADEILDIADNGHNDWMKRNGGLVQNNEAVQRSKLRVDSRKWVAARLLPKKYGDRSEVKHSGDPANPVAILLSDDAAKW